MEVLLMVVILHALRLHQGLQGAAIYLNENGTDTNRSEELTEKWSTEGGQHTPRLPEVCTGTLLALRHGRWVNVTLTEQSNKTKKDMAQICKDLGCGGFFAENGTAPMTTCFSDCTINSNQFNCTEAAPDNCSDVAEVVCAWQAVQLIGSNDRCAGRVELFGTGGWGSVCDDGWDIKGGDVVCAQLGCGTALMVMGEAGDFGPGSGPIYINQLNCSGTERNLWQCATELDGGRNYCGHKEDAAVVCSGSSYTLGTTTNTFTSDLTNWTTETVTEAAAEDSGGGISPPVLGCIFLSVTLFLLLVLNAAQCAYYKRRNGGADFRTASQTSRRDNSDTSSDSDYEHYHNHISVPEPPPTTVHNCEYILDDTRRLGSWNQEQERLCEERNSVKSPTVDSESTSSEECYEKIEAEIKKLLNPADKQLHPEYCIQMTPLHNPTKAAKRDSDSSDSGSTSSGECYENKGVNTEPFPQTLMGDPSFPEQPSTSHPKPQVAGNSSISQPYASDHVHTDDSESISSGECYENIETETEKHLNPEPYIQTTPLHTASEPAKDDSADSFDSDSTSSGECYENTETNAESCLQTLMGDPSFPEQPSLSHPKPQTAGNSSVSQPYAPDHDDSSISSEDTYENVAEIEDHSSSDDDYDDVSNW